MANRRIQVVQGVIVADTQPWTGPLVEAGNVAVAFADRSKKAFSTIDKDIKALGASLGLGKKEMADLEARAKSGLGMRQAEIALGRVGKAARMSTSELASLEARFGLQGAATRKMVAELAALEKKSLTSDKIKKDTDAVNNFSSSINRLKGIIAGYVGLNMLQGVADTSIRLDSIEKSFYAITGSMEGARKEMAWIRDESQRLGLDLFALADSYKGFSVAANSAGMSSEQTRKIFTSVTEASTVMGLSADRTKLALYALEQMISKGAVSMEELRRQLGDQLPGAFQLAAKAMGMTTAELTKKVVSGTLQAAELLPKLADEISRTFGPGLAEALKTPRAEIQRLKNEITLAQNAIGTGGFLAGLAGSAKDLRQSLQTGDMQSNLQSLGYTLGVLTGAMAKVVSVVLENGHGLASLAVAYGGVGLAVRAATPAIVAWNIATEGTVGKVAAARAGLGALISSINPITLAITGLGAAAIYVATSQTDGERVMDKYAQTLGLLGERGEVAAAALKKSRDEIVNLSTAQTRASIKISDQEIAALEDQLSSVINDLKFSPAMDVSGIWTGLSGTARREYAKILEDIKNQTIGAEEAIDAIATTFENSGEKSADFSRGLINLVNAFVLVLRDNMNLKSHLDDINKTLADTGLASREAAEATRELELAMAAIAKIGEAEVKSLADSITFMDKITEKSDFFVKKKKEETAATIESSMAKIAEGQAIALLAKDYAKAAELGRVFSEFRRGLATMPKDKKSNRLSPATRQDIAVNRSVEEVRREAQRVKDEIDQIIQRNLELNASLDGNTLKSQLEKIDREYLKISNRSSETTAQLEADIARWKKEGRYTPEVAKFVEEYKQQTAELIKQAQEQQRLQIIEAKRADILKEIGFAEQYAGMSGDKIRAYKEQEKSLRTQLSYLVAANDEERKFMELQIQLTQARGEGNIGILFNHGMQNLGGESWDQYIDFWEKDLPGAFGKTTDAFGQLMGEWASGTKSIGNAWEDLGKTVQSVISDIFSQMASMYLRMAMFGNGSAGMGGLFGSLISLGSSFFGGGFTTDLGVGGQATGLIDNAGAFIQAAKGHAFSSSSGLSSYRNSIVSTPTYFPFAKGGIPNIGLMGEKPGSPGEAIMPLTRTQKGDLAVSATGLSTGYAAPISNIYISTPPGTSARTEQQRNNSGGFDTKVMIDMIDGAIAQGISTGRSKTARALKMSGIQ